MENEYMRRGFLLPEGSKNVIHIAHLKAEPSEILKRLDPVPTFMDPTKASVPFAPPMRQIFVPPDTTVKKLAALVGQRPFTVICDLAQAGKFVSVDDVLEFNVISALARKYGFMVIKAG